MLFKLLPEDSLIQPYPFLQLLLCRNRILHILHRQGLQHRRYRLTNLFVALLNSHTLLDLIQVTFLILSIVPPQLLLIQLTLNLRTNTAPIAQITATETRVLYH